MTMEELRQAWAELEEKCGRRERLETRRRTLTDEAVRLERRRRETFEAWKREEADVTVLEELTPQALWARIRGNREERLTKEQGEALAAKVKYEQARRAAENANADLERLRREMRELEGLDKEREALVREKEAILRAGGGATADRLDELIAALAGARSRLKELDEAIAAGERAIEAFVQMELSLDSAESWGTLDILGGGMVSTYLKRSHMKEANSFGVEAQDALLAFGRELADVKKLAQMPGIEMDGFTAFADYLWDGLFADLFVQHQIHDAQKSVDEVKRRLREDIHLLNCERTRTGERLAALEAEYRELLA